jgi:ubiquinone/menaquinone biosynthesis C-methylase UbiE
MSDSIRAFNKVADSYDDWYSHPQGNQIFNAELNVVDHLIPEKGFGVEVGAGTGIFAKHLTSVERLVICLDPSPKMLSHALKRGIISILGVGENLPFRQSVLDFAYLVAVVEFLDDPVTVFEDIRWTLKKSGSLTVLFINSDSVWGDFYRELGIKGDLVFKNAELYSFNQVVELLSLADFIVTSSVGTLTTGPMEQEVSGELVAPSSSTGVIAVTAYAFLG